MVRCEELDHEVERFRTRSLSGSCYPYSWLDATFLKQRQQERANTQAVVLATESGILDQALAAQ
jgi:putative transposase